MKSLCWSEATIESHSVGNFLKRIIWSCAHFCTKYFYIEFPQIVKYCREEKHIRSEVATLDNFPYKTLIFFLYFLLKKNSFTRFETQNISCKRNLYCCFYEEIYKINISFLSLSTTQNCKKFDQSMHANIIQVAQNQSLGFKGNFNAFFLSWIHFNMNLIWVPFYKINWMTNLNIWSAYQVYRKNKITINLSIGHFEVDSRKQRYCFPLFCLRNFKLCEVKVLEQRTFWK